MKNITLVWSEKKKDNKELVILEADHQNMVSVSWAKQAQIPVEVL